jgi:hypothetical protein
MMPIDQQTKIPEADVRAALDDAIAVLAQTSQEHAVEIGGYIHKAFRPNPELVPIGVAIMFHTGSSDLRRLMAKAVYAEVMANLVINIVLAELRKLPGVDEVFVRFEQQEQE